MNADIMNYIVMNSIFQRAYYTEINKLLPSWLRIKVDPSKGFFAAENFQSLLGKGSIAKNIKYCSRIQFEDDSQYSVYIPKTQTNFYFLSSRKSSLKSDHALCIAVNLCSKDVSISMPVSQELTFHTELESIGLANLKLALTGFGYGKVYKKCTTVRKSTKCFTFNSYWKMTSNIVLNSNMAVLNFDGISFASVDGKVRLVKLSWLSNIYLFCLF